MIKKLFFSILLLITIFTSCAAQIVEINSFKDNDVIRSFWIEDGKTIAVLGGRKVKAYSKEGNLLWQLNVEHFNITSTLKAILPDNTLVALSNNDGSYIWNKKLKGENLSILNGVDGKFMVYSVSDDLIEINIFSEAGETLWEYSGKFFIPLAILPEGKLILGMSFNKVEEKVEIIMIEQSKGTRIIASLKDYSLFSLGNTPLIETNKFSKKTIITISSAPWWAIISESGEIIVSGEKIPFSKTNLITSCGTGFAIANTFEKKLALISEKGEMLWTKDLKRTIQSISGNNSKLAVSTGNLGYPGEILIYDKTGKLEKSIEVSSSISGIQIAEMSSNLLGIQKYARIFYISF